MKELNLTQSQLRQIHQIYISHAHMDHLGYLFPLMNECNNA